MFAFDEADGWLDDDFLNGDMLYRKPITDFMMVEEQFHELVDDALEKLRAFDKPYTLWSPEVVTHFFDENSALCG